MQTRTFKPAHPLLKKNLNFESSATLDIIKTTVQKLNYEEPSASVIVFLAFFPFGPMSFLLFAALFEFVC